MMSGRIEVYLENQDFNGTVLEQGDIIENLHFLGAININAINYISDSTGKKVGWSLYNPPIIEISDQNNKTLWI